MTKRKMPQTDGEVLTKVLGEVIAHERKLYRDGLARLERRVEQLEARPTGIKYLGVWDRGRAYGKGDFVTKAGSLFCAHVDHPNEPGTDKTWQLAVKRGRDAKEPKA